MEMKSKEEIRDLVAEMLPEEKAALCSGADDWNTVAIDRLGIEGMQSQRRPSRTADAGDGSEEDSGQPQYAGGQLSGGMSLRSQL